MLVRAGRLESLVAQIFEAAGCGPDEARRVAESLVGANLVGHDSHGVIRVSEYIDRLRAGGVTPNRTPDVVLEGENLALLDADFGFGQVAGAHAVEIGIQKSKAGGLAAVGLRNASHLGRIGEWAEQAAEGGCLSLFFVNTNGGGVLVAPVGGIERKLSANPIAAGVPRRSAPPIILDLSTCAIAEGKVRVARNRGVRVPAGCLLDSKGGPTDDPTVFYGDPPGTILPMGGHKGYALSILVEILAGALTGGGCSGPRPPRFGQGMLGIFLRPGAFAGEQYLEAETSRFEAWLKSSAKADASAEILLPGDVERRTREARLRDGIDLDPSTWRQIADAAAGVGVDVARWEKMQ